MLSNWKGIQKYFFSTNKKIKVDKILYTWHPIINVLFLEWYLPKNYLLTCQYNPKSFKYLNM